MIGKPPPRSGCVGKGRHLQEKLRRAGAGSFQFTGKTNDFAQRVELHLSRSSIADPDWAPA
jgi:hypothetical protein